MTSKYLAVFACIILLLPPAYSDPVQLFPKTPKPSKEEEVPPLPDATCSYSYRLDEKNDSRTLYELTVELPSAGWGTWLELICRTVYLRNIIRKSCMPPATFVQHPNDATPYLEDGFCKVNLQIDGQTWLDDAANSMSAPECVRNVLMCVGQQKVFPYPEKCVHVCLGLSYCPSNSCLILPQVEKPNAGQPDKERLQDGEKELQTDKKEPQPNEEKLPSNEKELPADEKESPANEDLPVDGEELPVDDQGLPADEKELSSDGTELSSDETKLPSDETELPADSQELPAGEQDLQDDEAGSRDKEKASEDNPGQFEGDNPSGLG